MKKETVVRITKFLLEIMFYGGIIATLSLPWSVRWVAHFFEMEELMDKYNEIVISYFVLGVLAILILGELRKMFRTVIADDCFVQANVVSLQRMGTYSFIIAAICFILKSSWLIFLFLCMNLKNHFHFRYKNNFYFFFIECCVISSSHKKYMFKSIV